METAISEQKLINAIAKRDYYGAAAILYDNYAPTLFKIIYYAVKEYKKAIAILEETIAFIWNNFHNYYAQDKRLLLWMAGIARKQARQPQNKIINYFK